METRKILLIVGTAMVIYGGYYWYNNRKNDKSLTDIKPPANPAEQEQVQLTAGETNEVLTSIPTSTGSITRNSIGNFWK